MKVDKKKRHIQVEMPCRRVVYGNVFNMILPDKDKFEVGKTYKFFLVGCYLGKAKLLKVKTVYYPYINDEIASKLYFKRNELKKILHYKYAHLHDFRSTPFHMLTFSLIPETQTEYWRKLQEHNRKIIEQCKF